MEIKYLIKQNLKLIIFTLMLSFSCTELEVDVESELTPENFPTQPSHFEAAKGPIYSNLPSAYAIDYWRLQTLSTDEAIIPARGGNWDDGGIYRTLHKHTWNKDHSIITYIWEYGFRGITSCNQILKMFDNVPEGDLRNQQFAEIRMMRAFYYFLMLDNFGNVPILKSFGDDTPTSPRKDVFEFIEDEVLEILPYLPEKKDATTYGRPTKWMGHALLAKMYINAKVYTGTEMWNQCVEQCDAIINSGLFSLDADYKSMFLPTNGPGVKEFIFAIVYDAFKITGNSFTRYSLTPELKTKYQLGDRSPSNCLKTTPSFYDKFNLANDVRNTLWLIGKQYNSDGSPITVKTQYNKLNMEYTGPLPGSRDTIWQLEFTRNTWLRGDLLKMDTGNDWIAQYMGPRSVKFPPDKNWDPVNRSDNHDFPVFRYADILMMKAEALLRGATATLGHTPMSLVNMIRSRAGAPTFTVNPTLAELLDERAREFAWEAWRRNDLIRFGEYKNTWLFKYEESASYREIFPIPATQMNLNSKLVQNTGY